MDWQNPPARVKLYVYAVVAAAVPVYAWAALHITRLTSTYSHEQWLSLAGITVVSWISSAWVVRIPRTITWMAIADCLVLSIAMIYGVAAGVLAHGPSCLVAYWAVLQKTPLEHRGETLRWRNDQAAFNVAAGGIYAFLYGTIYYAVLPGEPFLAHEIVLPALLLAASYFVVNSASTHAVMTLAGQGSFKSLWSQNFPIVPLYYLASASGAAVILFFHRVAGPWAFLLAIPILMLVYYVHILWNEKYEEVRGLYMQTVQAFANSVDALDSHTDHKNYPIRHVTRTRAATLELATALGVDHSTYEALEVASMLHDVGKISIPSYILNKPHRLTKLEFQKMSTHPEVGAWILSSIDFRGPVIDIVRHHHENWDGSGYPSGLRGDDIPLGARILAVADFYEALRSPRAYRPPFDRDAAMDIMKRNAHRFDPRVFGKFLEIVARIEEQLENVDVPEKPEKLKERRDNRLLTDLGGAHAGALGPISAPQREVLALFEIYQTVGNSLSRTDTLTILAAKIEKIIPFDTLVIYEIDEGRGVLRAAYTTGRNKESFRSVVIDMGTRLAGWVAANGRMLYNVQPGPDVMTLPEEVRGQYHNAILAPLGHEERPIGAIALYTGTDHYTDDHMRLLEIIANRASIALYNAIRFEETQEDAFTDRLTGLHNSRFLYIFFEQTLSEAKRYKESLTVIEMDLDDFKSVNDRYGHHTGDRFLTEVGRVLKAHMRESDILVRYAGDEFIAVLPKTTMDQARLFSYRLQEAVDAVNVDVGVGKLLTLGLSLGVASYPDDGTNLESLLMSADRNMYENKIRRKRRRRIEEIEPTAHQPSLFGTDEIVGPRAG